MKEINFKVVFEPTPIRHMSVQCPECGKWFVANDISYSNTNYSCQIDSAEFDCPVCDTNFSCEYGNKPNIQEVESSEVYKGCLRRNETVTWEPIEG